MTDDDYGIGGPTITEQRLLDYANDKLDYDPVTQQFLDQLIAATDDAREKVGVVTDGMLTIHARETLQAMWWLLIESSEHDQCEHIIARPLQPTAIIVDEYHQWCQVCLPCAREWSLPKHFRKGGKYECQCCGHQGLPITTDTVQMTVLQHWNYVALLLLCPRCKRTINEREPTC